MTNLNYLMVLIAGYSRLYWVNHKKHETLVTNTPTYIHINMINNRLILKAWITNTWNLEITR